MTPTLAPPHPDDDHQADAADDVVFVQAPDTQPHPVAGIIAAADKAAATATVKALVVQPYRVLHNGEPFVGGDVVDVPGDVAEAWLRSGWVQLEPSRKGKA